MRVGVLGEGFAFEVSVGGEMRLVGWRDVEKIRQGCVVGVLRTPPRTLYSAGRSVSPVAPIEV